MFQLRSGKGAGVVLNYLSHFEENFSGNFFLACQPKESLGSKDGGGSPNPSPDWGERSGQGVLGKGVG